MSVLTIQSRVASGYVGNSAAVPCLQQFGLDCIAIDTVHLSNHPAHGSHRGRRVPAGDVADLLDGVAERGLLRTVDVVHSGYLGATDTGPVVLDTVDAVKRAAPMTPYCLDPVIGDNGTLYVEPDLVTFFRTKALPTADLVLPNLFEAECLLGRPLSGVDDAVAAARALQDKGPARVVVTGVEIPSGLMTVGADGPEIWCVETPRVDVASSGAGDVFAALILGCLFGRESGFNTALEVACGFVFELLTTTKALGKPDIALVQSLHLVADFTSNFKAKSIL